MLKEPRYLECLKLDITAVFWENGKEKNIEAYVFILIHFYKFKNKFYKFTFFVNF